MTPIPFGSIVPLTQADMTTAAGDVLGIGVVAGYLLLIAGLAAGGAVFYTVRRLFKKA